MHIELSLVREFEELYNKFEKNRKGLLEIEGIDKEHLDTGYLSRKFFSERLADISTNTNANLAERQGIAEYKSFTSSGIQKLLGYNDFYYYIKREKGKRYADKVISAIWDGHIYLHDAHGSDLRKVYCFATSLDKIVYLGRPYGDLHDEPPKHTKSFLSQVDKFVHDMGANLAGACALSDLLIWYTYFFKNEMGITNRCLWDDNKVLDPVCEKKFVNDMQGFVHLLNNNNRVDGDVIFSNISIFDMPNLYNLFDHIVYPDGSTPDFELIMELQKIFCRFFAKGREDGLPYKFPVVTFNIQTKDGMPVDNSFIDFVCNVNLEKGNFNIHMGEESKLSMCPMHKDTEILTVDGWKPVSEVYGGTLVATVNMDTNNIEWQRTASHEKWHTDKINIHKNKWNEIACHGEHELFYKRGKTFGVKKSKDIKKHDRIMISHGVSDYVHNDLWWLIGFYLGDGYYDTKTDRYMIGIKKDRKLQLLDNNKYVHRVGNISSDGIIRYVIDINIGDFCDGKAKDKKLLRDISKLSHDELSSLFWGLMDSDGCIDKNNTKTFITTSDYMKDTFNAIAMLLGYNCNNTLITDHKFIKNDKEYICDRCWYITVRDSYKYALGGTEMVEEDYNDYVYCSTVPNGTLLYRYKGRTFVQHQCRYVLDLDEMSQWSSDSFGNGGVNLGSHRVMTLNIPLIIAESRTAYEFYEKMEYYMDLVAESLYIHREYILKERFNKNPDFNPFFGRLGWFDVDTMLFSTFGITGVWDAEVYAKNNNINITALQILNFMQRRIKNYTNKYNRVYNIEQIPAEQTAVTLAKKSHWHGKLLDVDLYANQYIPLTENITPEYRLEYSGKCSNIITGGDIVHINIGNKLDTPSKMKRIIEWAIKYGVPHFAINYTFAECECGHKFISNGMDNIVCPICGSDVDNFLTRIIGYFSHTQNWNKTRRIVDVPNRKFKSI